MLAVRSAAVAAQPAPWTAKRGLLIVGASVVTMDDRHTVVRDGRVLVRNGRIVGVWSGHAAPPGVSTAGARVVRARRGDLLFPGLINLHDHPRQGLLQLWPPPSNHAVVDEGKSGRDAYANRYQWSATRPPELDRLVSNAADVVAEDRWLGLRGEVVKYAEVRGVLGGQTAMQGASRNAESDGVLIRNVDNDAFDTRVARPWVPAISTLDGPLLAELRDGMIAGRFDAWLVHLAEGVRDADRRPGDSTSSRAELGVLKDRGLLTDLTVVIHGVALERADFAALRAATTIRADGVSDGRGAKLVWSPLSNLLLYGRTANVYEALSEGVLVSLGTDWAPSGSRTLLHELKVADVALRDVRVLGASRDDVAELSLAGKDDSARRLAEQALDRTLVDMVTRNPALTLRWYDKAGSIEAGKVADLVLLHRPTRPAPGVVRTVYRDLIDATQRDVGLVLVGGDPLAGDVPLLASLKPNDHEVVRSAARPVRESRRRHNHGPRARGTRDAAPDHDRASGWPLRRSAVTSRRRARTASRRRLLPHRSPGRRRSAHGAARGPDAAVRALSGEPQPRRAPRQPVRRVSRAIVVACFSTTVPSRATATRCGSCSRTSVSRTSGARSTSSTARTAASCSAG